MKIIKRHSYDEFNEAVFIGGDLIRVGWFVRHVGERWFRCGRFTTSYTLRIGRFCVSIRRR